MKHSKGQEGREVLVILYGNSLCQFLCLPAQVLSPPRNLSVPQQFEMPALESCYIGGQEYEIHHLALSFSVKFIFHVSLMLALLL